MASKKKKRQRSRDKEREREKERDRKKSKKRRERSQEKKKKHKESKKYISSSDSSSSQSSSDSESYSRSRSHDKKSKKKREKSKDKVSSTLPFEVGQPTPPIFSIRGPPGMMIPPPAPPSTTTPTIPKAKTKQYHIFKLLPKLPPGPVAIGHTIYSSKYLSKQFEKKLLTQMCDQLQKSSRNENAKKMASLISRAKNDILAVNSQPQALIQPTGPNQFLEIDRIYHQKFHQPRTKTA